MICIISQHKSYLTPIVNISRICFPCNQPTSIITPIKKTVKGINVKPASSVASWGQEKNSNNQNKAYYCTTTKIIYFIVMIPLVLVLGKDEESFSQSSCPIISLSEILTYAHLESESKTHCNLKGSLWRTGSQ